MRISFTKFLTFLLLLSVSAFSQTTFTGLVEDSSTAPVPFVSVTLKYSNDNSIVAYTSSDSSGNYSLTVTKGGQFILSFSSLSYTPVNIPVTVTGEKKNVLQNVELKDAVVELEEVIIENQGPIVVKKDTIVFDAKAFAQGNEQVVEDLLKKIPGINVTEDGTVKIGNREVEKIMVDGDDFFERGYKILTKNMPPNPIDKIEVLERYSNNKLLKDLENSDKVALNLTLKDDLKRQWFGNVSAGYGLVSEDRYEVRTNLMNFGKKNKYYFLSNLNNIGADATGDINHLIRPYRANEPGNIGDDQSAYSLLSLSSQRPDLKPERINFNNTEMVSANAIFTLSKKIKLKTLGFFNWDENDHFRNSYDTYLLNGESFTNTEDYTLRKKKVTGFGKVDLMYDITKTSTLEYTGKYNNSGTDYRSDLIFNGDPTNERLRSDNELSDHRIVYTNRQGENRALLLTGRYIKESTPQVYRINKFFFEDLFPGAETADKVSQNSRNTMSYAGFEAYLTQKSQKGNLIELQAGNQYREDLLDTSFAIKDAEVVTGMPAGFQNDVWYITNNLYAKGKYSYNYKSWTFFTQLALHQFINHLGSGTVSRKQNPFFVNPRLGFDWEINKKNKVTATYSHNTNNASVLDVYDNYILTDFRSFYKGTGTFNQTDASSVFLNYTMGGWGEKFFVNFFGLYNKSHDFLSSNSVITPNYALSEKILIKDREFVTLAASVDRFIKLIKSNLKAEAGFTSSNYKNIVNDNLREVSSYNYNYGIELRSGFKGMFNYHLGTKWTYSKIEANFSSSYTNNMSFLDLYFVLNSKFDVQLQGERYYFGNLSRSDNTYYFLDAEARYTASPNKLTFSLSCRNLFNTETFREYSISDVAVSGTEYRLLPRYLLLKMEYHFN